MEREKKIIRTSALGILVNIVLVAFKAVIGIITNSIAIVLDAVNNLTDVISSVVTIIGTKIANKAPDEHHPYGHGRVEYFTSIIVSAIVLIAGVTAFKESVEKIISKQVATYSITSVVIVTVAVLTKFFLGRYVKATGKKLNSQSLIASGEDALMDSILSFSTLVAALVNMFAGYSIEGYIGILISIVIFKSAVEMLKDTLNIMIGERADKELTDSIKKAIMSYDKVQGVYDLSLHTYGPLKTIGTAHIQIPDDMTAKEIHILARKITVDLFNRFGIVMTIGIYAANDSDEYKEIKTEIANIMKEYEHLKQIHGFFVDEETKSVYFDVIFEFACKNREEVRDEIIAKLKKKFGQYNFYIIIDDDITD